MSKYNHLSSRELEDTSSERKYDSIYYGLFNLTDAALESFYRGAPGLPSQTSRIVDERLSDRLNSLRINDWAENKDGRSWLAIQDAKEAAEITKAFINMAKCKDSSPFDEEYEKFQLIAKAYDLPLNLKQVQDLKSIAYKMLESVYYKYIYFYDSSNPTKKADISKINQKLDMFSLEEPIDYKKFMDALLEFEIEFLMYLEESKEQYKLRINGQTKANNQSYLESEEINTLMKDFKAQVEDLEISNLLS